MNIFSFVDQASKPDFFENRSVICFRGTTPPSPMFFFSFLIKEFKDKSPIRVESLDLQDQDEATVKARLATSFLGSQTIYWLRDFDALDEKSFAAWKHYVSTYNGPNVILFFTTRDAPLRAQDLLVEVPCTIQKAAFVQMLEREKRGTAAHYAPIITELFTRVDSVSLDQAYALVRYINLVGTSQQEFITTWLDVLVIPEKSLFDLSTLFFAKDSKKFFIQWQKSADEYPAVFWATFWSEQIWRAYNFVLLSKQQQFALAKRVGFRLPFSFMQRDWKKHTPQELRDAHNFIYSVDFNLKNGCDDVALDLFYSKYFMGGFKN
jgi:hypothetical protein